MRNYEKLKCFFISRSDYIAIELERQDGTRKPFPAILKKDTLDKVLISHITGQEVKLRLKGGGLQLFEGVRAGAYSPDLEGFTKFLCFDVDSGSHAASVKEPLTVVKQITEALNFYGVDSYTELSNSGNGYHIWVFFGAGVTAKMARKLGFLICPDDVDLESGEKADPRQNRGLEIFPKQDKLYGQDSLGNLVWLPWYSKSQGGCVFIDVETGQHLEPDFKTVSLEKVTETITQLESWKEARLENNKVLAPVSSYDWKRWRKEALNFLDLRAFYGDILTGKQKAGGWLEARDAGASGGDKNPSAGVATGEGQAEKGTFHSFISGASLSVFDYLISYGGCGDFIEAAKKVADFTGVALPEREGVDVSPAKTKDGTRPSKSFREIVPGVLTLTDLGNSRRLEKYFGSDLKYCFEKTSWFFWDSKRWERDIIGKVVELAKKTVDKIYSETKLVPDEPQPEKGKKKTTLRERVFSHAIKSEGSEKIHSMIKLARSSLPIKTAEMDLDKYFFNVLNGTIDLKDGSIREHRREDYITKLAPVVYKQGEKCPRFIKFIKKIMLEDTELVEYLQRCFGYAMTGDTSEQCLFFFYGTGANGKSTLLDLIGRVLGDYSKTAAPELLVETQAESHPTAIADLEGCRFLAVSEPGEENKKLAENLVKQLTGEDKIKARFMRQDFFEFEPRFKLFFAANNKPVIKGMDLGIWRRIKLIPFLGTIPEHEREKKHILMEQFLAESAGILNWLIEGALKWAQDGLKEPAKVSEATSDYKDEMDTVGNFLTLNTMEKPGDRITKTLLYNTFKGWLQDNNLPHISSVKMGSIMKQKGYQDSKSGAKRYWENLELKILLADSLKNFH